MPFESGQLSGSSDVYKHEIPGGQFTNLLYQSKQLGLTERWPEIKRKYAEANLLLGDIPKVLQKLLTETGHPFLGRPFLA